jgi:hypothetical protein
MEAQNGNTLLLFRNFLVRKIHFLEWEFKYTLKLLRSDMNPLISKRICIKCECFSKSKNPVSNRVNLFLKNTSNQRLSQQMKCSN